MHALWHDAHGPEHGQQMMQQLVQSSSPILSRVTIFLRTVQPTHVNSTRSKMAESK